MFIGVTTPIELFEGNARIEIRVPTRVCVGLAASSFGALTTATLVWENSHELGIYMIACGLILAIYAVYCSTYRVTTIINKLGETATYRTCIFGVRRCIRLSLKNLSLLANIHSTDDVCVSVLFLVEAERRYKIAEIMSPGLVTVRDPALVKFVTELQSVYAMPYKEAF